MEGCNFKTVTWLSSIEMHVEGIEMHVEDIEMNIELWRHWNECWKKSVFWPIALAVFYKFQFNLLGCPKVRET